MTTIPSSPCIGNCCLNEQDICLGCFRTLTEITEWHQANAQQRLLILEAAQNRRQQCTQNHSLMICTDYVQP